MRPFAKFKKDFQGKRVLILGIGVLGRGVDVVRVFAQVGCWVKASDLKTKQALQSSLEKLKSLPIEYRLGGHKSDDLASSDVVIRNPAVHWQHPLLRLARKKHIPVLMDSALFAQYFPGTIIGITGTRGKTTTTMLVYKLLESAKGKNAFLAGNATKKANISLLKKATRNQIAVMELSSWELQGFRQMRKSPHIAIVTNVYQDHLDRYKNMKEYVADKAVIFAYQKKSDYVFLNSSNSWTKKMANLAPSKVVWFEKEDFPSDWTLSIIGEHNLENAAAAFKVGRLLGVNQERMKSVFVHFKGVPHRLEIIDKINGITFVNDTTSTTPTATISALRAISAPKIILVGGNSKNLSLGALAREISQRSKGIILLKGNGTPALKKKLAHHKNIPILKENLSFRQAVVQATKAAQKGDVVLLSPGFTSFAEFNNEFERGEEFKKIVKELAAQ